ncbi:MAG: hypothetical protein KDD42_10125, partial [Bdellovibrionales bacterium]|nr:hypothetical protein [Bdellovibrionales bacterium]
ELASEKPLVKFFPGILKYRFPNRKYIRQLTTTNLLVVHSVSDRVISYQQGLSLIDSYQGKGLVRMITLRQQDHVYNLAPILPELDAMLSLMR